MPEHAITPVVHLRHWLAERSEPELALLARLWSLAPSIDPKADALAAAMLRPATIRQLVASLKPREREALQYMQARGGEAPAAAMEREFGTIRSAHDYPHPRAYLLALAQPPSPIERLYLLALLQPAGDQHRRAYAIPPDLLALLPPVPKFDLAASVPPAADPPQTFVGNLRRLERRLLLLLTLAQDGQLEVIPRGGLNKASLLRLVRQIDPGENLKGVTREDQWPYMQFIRRLAQGAGMLRVDASGLLRPTREALDWLRQPQAERARRLLRGWVASDWDELVSFVGLKLQRAYGRDLAATKRAMLRLFGQLPPGQWVAFDAFGAAVKQASPDFARPHGRYDTWGIVNHLRQPLDGFEFWDQVEGQQLRNVGGGTLFWLGLVDLGGDGEKTVSFRVNDLGAALLRDAPAPAEPPNEPLVVQPNFDVLAPAFASPYDLFQLARLADRGSGDDEAAVFKLTRRSVQAAVERGSSIDDMLRFLDEASAHGLPQNVAATLRDWAGQHGQVELRPAVLLEAQDSVVLEQIKRDKRVRLPEVEQLTERAWLVRPGDAPLLAERLRKAGYGLSGEADAADQPLSEHDLTVLFAALEFYATACAALHVDGDASVALRRRVARLLPEKQLNRAYQSSHAAIVQLKEELGIR